MLLCQRSLPTSFYKFCKRPYCSRQASMWAWTSSWWSSCPAWASGPHDCPWLRVRILTLCSSWRNTTTFLPTDSAFLTGSLESLMNSAQQIYTLNETRLLNKMFKKKLDVFLSITENVNKYFNLQCWMISESYALTKPGKCGTFVFLLHVGKWDVSRDIHNHFNIITVSYLQKVSTLYYFHCFRVSGSWNKSCNFSTFEKAQLWRKKTQREAFSIRGPKTEGAERGYEPLFHERISTLEKGIKHKTQIQPLFWVRIHTVYS